MSNVDPIAAAYRDRLIRIEEERRARVEDAKDIGVEMKDSELSKDQIAGIKLAVRRHFESVEKRIFRESAESFAAALGDFADSPLGSAAVVRHHKGAHVDA